MKNIFNRKSVFVKSLSVWSAFAVIITTSAPAFAAGTAVLGGSADLQNLTRATMDKNDPNAAVFSSDAASAVLDWNRFNIGSGQSMSFNGAGTTFFNLVDGAAGRSQIDGIINGSGNVWVINPAGIAFGASSSVNVGGLFAAAAGNLENAAALRDGTATMPSFSSFEGSVDASKGAFTASQVALMGKTVSAEGDFSNVGNLTISATGGAMDVDEVQGGKVSVNIRDFTADGSEVTLGDLHIDGDLTVKATGSIMAGAKAAETPANKPMLLMAEKKGPVIQAGDIDIEGADLEIEGKLQSTAGHVDVLAYGSLDVNAEVNAADYASLQALGDIDVNADVIAGGGDATIYSYNGSVTVEAGKTVSALGNVDITAGMGDGVNGDVTIDGNVESSFGNVMLYSGYGDQSTGDVTINGNVTAEYGGIDAYAGFGYALGTSGKLTVNGNLTGYSSVSLKTGNGGIKVGENSVVSATGEFGEVDVYTAADAGYGIMSGEGHSGDIVVNGSLKADNVYGVVDVVAGKEVGATGAITFNGNASSDYMTELATRTGKVSVDGGEVSSSGNVMINNESGDITIAQGASVISKGGSQGQAFDEDYGIPSAPSVMVLGAMDENGTSNVKIDGTVTALDPNGQITIRTGFDGRTLPGGFIGGTGAITGEGEINSAGALEMSTGLGEVNFAGVVKAKDADFKVDELLNEYFKYRNSGLFLENAENDFTGKFTAQAGVIKVRDANDITLGEVTAYRDFGDTRPGEDRRAVTVYAVDGTLTVSEDAVVKTEGLATIINLVGGTGTKTDPDGNPILVKGNVNIKGDVRADVPLSEINIMSGTGANGGVGNIVIDGKVSAVTPEEWAEFAGNNLIEIASGYMEGSGKSDVKINSGAEVVADGTVFLSAGDGWGYDSMIGDMVQMGGEGDLYVDGIVNGGHHSTLVTHDGNITIDRAANVSISAPGEVTIVSGKKDGGSGAIIANGEVHADVDGGMVLMSAGYGRDSHGNIEVGGDVSARQIIDLATGSGNISVQAGAIIKATAEKGEVSLASATQDGKVGHVVVDGSVNAHGNDSKVYLFSGEGNESSGSIAVGGTVSSGAQTLLYAGKGFGSTGSASVTGSVKSQREVDILTKTGSIAVDGEVSGGDVATLITGTDGGQGGSIGFTSRGHLTAKSSANIQTTHGNLTQEGAIISVSRDGFAESKNMASSVSAEEVNFSVDGNIGEGAHEYVAIDGRIYAQVSGSASIAAANGRSFSGGSKPSHTPNVSYLERSSGAGIGERYEIVDLDGRKVPVKKYEVNLTPAKDAMATGIDWGVASDNSSVFAGGDLSIYTAGALNPYGLLVAGRDLTVSAASFGDMSYLRAGGKLTINNVGHPSHPQIAYFESVNGVEPNINNLPNDMVIFIDGRLAGGNLNILNKFGANEAFMVETPELKSTQGIFGNPPFLHSDLDVANPMAVSAVDYLIQEVPRLTLSSDFPAEVDQNVEAVGLSQKDVYWFGQKGSDEKKASDEAAEKTAETDKGSEKPSDKTVALVR